MRFDYWTLLRFLHIGGAILWVGGQLVLSLVVRPVAMRVLDDTPRRHLITTMGARFARLAAWGLIPVLLATGLALSYRRGVLQSAFQIPGYGAILSTKVVLALVTFALAAAHGVAAASSSTRLARTLGVTGAGISVAVVLLAVTLTG